MITHKQLGDLIKKLRVKNKMSISDLAKISGVNRQTIYRLERGDVYARIESVDMLFIALKYKFVLGEDNNG